MKWRLLLLLLVPVSLPAQGWRVSLTASADMALWIDCMQTLRGLPGISTTLSNGFTYIRPWREGNVLLGNRPVPASVIAYNGALVLGNTFAPRKFRPFINGLTVAVEILVIHRNAQDVGIRFTP